MADKKGPYEELAAVAHCMNLCEQGTPGEDEFKVARSAMKSLERAMDELLVKREELTKLTERHIYTSHLLGECKEKISRYESIMEDKLIRY